MGIIKNIEKAHEARKIGAEKGNSAVRFQKQWEKLIIKAAAKSKLGEEVFYNRTSFGFGWSGYFTPPVNNEETICKLSYETDSGHGTTAEFVVFLSAKDETFKIAKYYGDRRNTSSGYLVNNVKNQGQLEAEFIDFLKDVVGQRKTLANESEKSYKGIGDILTESYVSKPVYESIDDVLETLEDSLNEGANTYIAHWVNFQIPSLKIAADSIQQAVKNALKYAKKHGARKVKEIERSDQRITWEIITPDGRDTLMLELD